MVALSGESDGQTEASLNGQNMINQIQKGYQVRLKD